MAGRSANFRDASRKLVCPQCGMRFETYSKDRVNCSRQCFAKSLIKPKVEKVCAHCATQFFVRPSVEKWNNDRSRGRSFCSRSCLSLFFKGEGSPNWKPDRLLIRNQNKTIRMSAEMKAWRKAVFQRDNFSCVWCQKRSKVGEPVVLNAHHILPYSKFPELRFLLLNGATLCEPCHKDTYGKEEGFALQLTARIVTQMFNKGRC